MDEEIESILYTWNILTKDIFKTNDYHVDVMILDVTELLILDIEIPNLCNIIRKKILDKMLVCKFIVTDEKLDSYLESINVSYKYIDIVKDYMNKCSHIMDNIINRYIPYTSVNVLFSDDMLIADEIDKGVYLKNVRFISNDESEKLLLSFNIFRKRGVV